MLKTNTLQFLATLQQNNNRDWFHANKDWYLDAFENFQEVVGVLIEHLSKQKPELAILKPKDCIFRIYRDVRFAKDKRPYKTGFSAAIRAGGKNAFAGGYYFHVEAGNQSAYGGGVWRPPSEKIKALRQEIDYCTDEFKAIIDEPAFIKLFQELQGESLKTAPKGYAKDHPDIILLRRKDFLALKKVSDRSITSKNAVRNIVEGFRVVTPLNDFLNRAFV